jgi:hypothetical protein
MFRALLGTTAILSLTAAVPALAADYSGGFQQIRPAYAQDWGMADDSLQFEAGVRYWYSLGEQEHEIGGFSETMNTQTSSGEAFVRIDDKVTNSYVEAFGGYGISHDGDYSTNGGPSLDLPAARLGYGGADFGWLPFGNEAASVGFVTGYQYTNDSPDTGRVDFTTAETSSDISWSNQTGEWSVGGDSEINNFDVHALKLGIAGRFDADVFDITGEAYATPYAWVSGTYGAYDGGFTDSYAGGPDGISYLQGSAASINGFGYGAGGKLMVGFHPTENLTIRVGGRASYLQGQYDATYDAATITHPTSNPPTVDPDTGVVTPADPAYDAPTLSRQTYISDNNPFSMRDGGLLEVSGRF